MCWYAPIVSLWWVFPYKDADPITKHQNNLNMSFLNCHYSHRNAVILFAAVAHSSITTGRIYRRQNKRKHNRAISRFSVEQKALQLIKPLSNSSLVIFKLMTMCCQWRKYSEKVFHWELKVTVHVILIIQYNIIHLFNIQSVQRCCSPPCQACCCPSQSHSYRWRCLWARQSAQDGCLQGGLPVYTHRDRKNNRRLTYCAVLSASQRRWSRSGPRATASMLESNDR